MNVRFRTLMLWTALGFIVIPVAAKAGASGLHLQIGLFVWTAVLFWMTAPAPKGDS